MTKEIFELATEIVKEINGIDNLKAFTEGRPITELTISDTAFKCPKQWSSIFVDALLKRKQELEKKFDEL